MIKEAGKMSRSLASTVMESSVRARRLWCWAVRTEGLGRSFPSLCDFLVLAAAQRSPAEPGRRGLRGCGPALPLHVGAMPSQRAATWAHGPGSQATNTAQPE